MAEAIPDYEHALDHPVMTALKWTAAALVALVAFPAGGAGHYP